MRVKRSDMQCKHDVCPFALTLYPDDDKDYELLEKLCNILERKDGHKLHLMKVPNGGVYLCFLVTAIHPCVDCDKYEGDKG